MPKVKYKPIHNYVKVLPKELWELADSLVDHIGSFLDHASGQDLIDTTIMISLIYVAHQNYETFEYKLANAVKSLCAYRTITAFNSDWISRSAASALIAAELGVFMLHSYSLAPSDLASKIGNLISDIKNIDWIKPDSELAFKNKMIEIDENLRGKGLMQP